MADEMTPGGRTEGSSLPERDVAPDAAENAAEEWVVLAQVLRPQGRKGECLAELLTDFPESLVGREGLMLAPEQSETPGPKWRACEVLSCWMPRGKNEGRAVLGFAGVTDISGAEALAGLELRTRRTERRALEDDAEYVDDLLGCELVDGDVVVGRVTDVQQPTTADGRKRLEEAPALLVVETERGEVMVPFVAAHLRAVDAAGRRIVMELPAGLIEAQLG